MHLASRPDLLNAERSVAIGDGHSYISQIFEKSSSRSLGDVHHQLDVSRAI